MAGVRQGVELSCLFQWRALDRDLFGPPATLVRWAARLRCALDRDTGKKLGLMATAPKVASHGAAHNYVHGGRNERRKRECAPLDTIRRP